MKKSTHIFFTANLWGMILIFICSSCKPNQSDVPFAKSIDPLAAKTGEDILDLSANPLSKNLGLAEMDVFYNDVLINRKKHPIIEIENIDVNALAYLQDTALLIGGANPKNFVLALKIKYGLDTSYNQVELLYEPLFLQKNDSVSKYNFGYKTINSHPVYFSYNKTINKFLRVSDTSSSFARYKDSISFKERYKQTFRRYVNKQDITGDVAAVIFPFQEIDSVIAANKASSIYIFNAGEYIQSQKDVYLKHTLLLGTSVNKGFIFFSNFGNLSHLCPPSCDQHYYDLKH